MNRVELIGRVTKDANVATTDKDKFVVSFSLAVDRYHSENADFISCVVWGEYGYKMSKYLLKGARIGVSGNLHSRTYTDKNGSKHYVTEVNVEHIDLLDSKPQSQAADNSELQDEFLLDIDEGLPI